MERETFLIQIGDFKREYCAYATRAPRVYDGFGTISLHDDKVGERWVLVSVEHEQWQCMRYASGNCTPTPVEMDSSEKKWIVDRLYRRIMEVTES